MVLIDAVLLGGRSHLPRRVQTVPLPAETPTDRPGQNPGKLRLQLLPQLRVLFCAQDRHIEWDQLDPAPDTLRPVGDLWLEIRIKPEGMAGIEVEWLFELVLSLQPSATRQVLQLGRIQAVPLLCFAGRRESDASQVGYVVLNAFMLGLHQRLGSDRLRIIPKHAADRPCECRLP